MDASNCEVCSRLKRSRCTYSRNGLSASKLNQQTGISLYSSIGNINNCPSIRHSSIQKAKEPYRLIIDSQKKIYYPIYPVYKIMYEPKIQMTVSRIIR